MRMFDAIVIGAGQAGPALADRLTAAGMTVAVIERKLIGGTCVNTGCTPTKSMVASAYAARLARRAADYGLEVDSVRVDMKAVKARVDTIVSNSRSNLEDWLVGMRGCTLIRGHARFAGPKSVAVDGEELSAERIFINVGGRPRRPDMPGINDVRTLDNGSLLKLDEVPRHLVVVGGSYVGLEFAQIFRRLGSKVTVVEQAPRLIMREDEDVSGECRSRPGTSPRPCPRHPRAPASGLQLNLERDRRRGGGRQFLRLASRPARLPRPRHCYGYLEREASSTAHREPADGRYPAAPRLEGTARTALLLKRIIDHCSRVSSFSVLSAHQEMRRWSRDSGTGKLGRKRRGAQGRSIGVRKRL